MKQFNLEVLRDYYAKLDEMESIINLINADENDEAIKENLQSVVDHITFAFFSLGATLDIVGQD